MTRKPLTIPSDSKAPLPGQEAAAVMSPRGATSTGESVAGNYTLAQCGSLLCQPVDPPHGLQKLRAYQSRPLPAAHASKGVMPVSQSRQAAIELGGAPEAFAGLMTRTRTHSLSQCGESGASTNNLYGPWSESSWAAAWGTRPQDKSPATVALSALRSSTMTQSLLRARSKASQDLPVQSC